MPTLRTEGISTSDLMARILKDRTDLMIRNLGKGVARDDMGISILRYWVLKGQKKYKGISRSVKRIIGKIRKTVGNLSEKGITRHFKTGKKRGSKKKIDTLRDEKEE